MRLRELAAAAALALACDAGRACGPDFPADLLGNRAATLHDLPEGAFNFEAVRLVAPGQRLPVVEDHDESVSPDRPAPSRESVERGWWGDRYERIAAARGEIDGEHAFAASNGLPAEARHYIAGAVAFDKGDLRLAAERFQSVLALPAGERAHYGVWAQFMLGRIAREQHRGAEAIAAFAATRALVAGADSDPLGVGAASLGEEARVHLEAGADAQAIALYAQQAALGSIAGRDSLLFVARAVVADDARLERAAADPLAQRLLVAYLFSRSDELSDTHAEPGVDDTRAPQPTPPKITRFLAAVERLGLDHVAGADRLAALAYRSGNYDLATKLAPKDASGLAWWVRAKLALRAGDAAGAAQAYAQAAQAFPAGERWGEPQMMIYDAIKPQCRVEGEHGALALSRGEYLQAMEHLYNAATEYWPDAAYVAERVLTLDELKAFVDAHAGKPTAAPAPKDPDTETAYGLPDSPAGALRALLARRLLRADRFDEALAYFDTAALRAKAQGYVEARRAATHGDRIEQAQAWYAAARAARVDGMELLGYEGDPDYQVYAGDFDLNFHADADGNAVLTRDDIAVPAEFSGKDEASRVAASRAQPLKRFHYRYTAAEFAQKSADLLPPRTQAFAAVLCHATGWLIDRDPPVAEQIYKRYVRQGPHVPWAAAFGRECPAPDFAAAAVRLHKERVAHFRHLARRSLPYVAAAGALLIVLITVAVRRRRMRKSGASGDRS